MNFSTHEQNVKDERNALTPLFKIVNNMDYCIHTALNSFSSGKVNKANDEFVKLYIEFYGLFRGVDKKVFLYKVDYETNLDIFIYCCKILKNQYRLLELSSFYYDSDINEVARNTQKLLGIKITNYTNN